MTTSFRVNPVFTKLLKDASKGTCDHRISATEKLVTYLQSQNEEDIDIAVNRIVRGMAAQTARLGFATILTHLLREIPSITIEKLFVLMDSALEISKDASKKEMNDFLLGKIMVYLSIIQSDLILKATESQVEKIVQGILLVKEKKQILGPFCSQAIKLLVVKVPSQVFQMVVFSQLKPDLSHGWEKSTPDQISMLLAVHKFHKDVIEKGFLKAKWGSTKPLSTHAFAQLGKIVESTKKHRPVVHPVCIQILQSATAENFGTVWKKVFQEPLNKEKETWFILMNMIPLALAEENSHSHIKTILPPEIVTYIFKHCSKKEDNLQTLARNTLQNIGDLAEKMKSGKTQYEMLMCLVSVNGGLNFDQCTKTHAISTIVSKLNNEGIKLLWNTCKKILKSDNAIISENNGHEQEVMWACQQLPLLLNFQHLKADAEFQLDILKYLLENSYFKRDEQNISDQTRIRMKQAYNKSLTKAANICKGKDKNIYVHILSELNKFTLELVVSNNYEILTAWEDDTTDSLKTVMGLVDKITTQSNASNQKMGQAFEFLLLMLGQQLMSEGDEVSSYIEDVKICYEKAQAKTKKRESKRKSVCVDNEPAWVEVITELLLSLLARESQLLRTVVKTVFSMLGSSMTPNAINIIIEALESGAGDDEALAFEEDEEEEMEVEEEEDESSEDQKQENGKDEESSEESSSDEDSGDEDEDLDNDAIEDLRKNVKAALGKAAADSEGEEEQEELGDDEMFALDKVLANVLKQKLKGKKADKEKQKQMTEFKTKILDLLMGLEQSEVSPALLVPLLIPVLTVMESSLRDSKAKDLHQVATKTYKHLLGIKIKGGDPVDVQETIDVLEKLITLSSKVTGYQMILNVGSGCAYLVNLIMGNTGVSHSELISGTYSRKKTVKEILEPLLSVLREEFKKFSQHRDLIMVLVEKCPVIFWLLKEDILELLKSTKKVFLKTKTCIILGHLVTKMKMVDEQTATDFSSQIVTACHEIVDQCVKEKEFKPMLLKECFTLLKKVAQHLSVEACKKLLSEELVKNIELVKAGKKDKTDIKQACNSLLGVLQSKKVIDVSKKNKQTKVNKRQAQVESEDEDLPPKKRKELTSNGDNGESLTENKTNDSGPKSSKKSKKKGKAKNA